MSTTIPFAVVAAAQAAQRKWNGYASVTCAQWALESAWGTHLSGKNNPFGIKAKAGEPCTPCETWEVIGGVRKRVVQNFRDFASLDEAFDAHGRLLAQGEAYGLARSFVGKRDAEGYANALTGHYATDPQYGAKLISIMRANGLYPYDEGGAPVTKTAPAVASVGPVTTGPHITGLTPAPAQPGLFGRLASLFGRRAA